ncbi:MAG TPA: type 4a pilus biogenesis protein PilO [Solimonas sp.]
MNLQEAIQQLNSLDPQNPGIWPQWVRIGAVIVAALFVLAGGIYFLAKPVYDDLQIVEGEEVGLRDELENKQKKVAGLDAYREQLAEMERSFGAMLRQLPSKAEVANLLNDISQTRVASSLEEELFQPQGEIPRDFYAEIPNRITVVGNYAELGTFVSGVAALPRIVTVSDIEIRPTGSQRLKEGATPLRMTATAKTFRYLDDDELPGKGGRR